MGLLQGIAEMFPVSSLGHTVLVPAWLGWHNLVNSESASESFYLAFVVGLHVATALALIVVFWRDWVRIIGGLLSSIRDRRIETPTQRLGWLLVIATIPAGITGATVRSGPRRRVAAAGFSGASTTRTQRASLSSLQLRSSSRRES
jgi:undecaprenyl-diphosphatase